MNVVYQRFLLLVILLLVSSAIKAQEPVTMQELQMKQCFFDSTADALILFAKGETVVDFFSTSGTVVKYFFRIKIFKKSAIQEWSNIILDSKKHEITKITGTTYNFENGKIIETSIEKASIYEGSYDKNLMARRIPMPNVKEGSIVEYSYVQRSRDHYLPSWTFQRTIPTLYSEYEIRVPTEAFSTDLRGIFKPKIHEVKYNGKYQRWVMEELPAFKAEPLMPHKDIYVSKVVFWSKENDWSKVNTNILTSAGFGGILYKRSKTLREISKEVIGDEKNPMDIIKRASVWIKSNIEWTAYCDYFSDEPEEIIKRKKGSSGDINLLLAAMLIESGLDVETVILSTKDNGFIFEERPSEYQFNYIVCLAHVNKKDIFLDATEKLLAYNLLPSRCLNYKGFVISKTNPRWIALPATGKDKVNITEDITIEKDLSATGTITTMADEYGAFNLRSLKSTEPNFKNPLVANQAALLKDYTTYTNTDQYDKPFVIGDSLQEITNIQNSGDKIYIDPFADLILTDNPFLALTREFPVEFETPIDNFKMVNITVPENYEIEEVPKSGGITIPGNAARFVYNVTVSGQRINLAARYQINNPYILQYEYPALRELYSQMLAKQSEKIVLIKK